MSNKIKWIIGIAIVITLALFLIALPQDKAGAVQETCPEGDGWVKVDGIDTQTYHYDAPDGKLVTDSCYKASTTLIFDTYVPPVEEVDLSSTVWNKEGCPEARGCNYQDISHASFKLVDEVTPTPTEEVTPTATPSATLTPTPTTTQNSSSGGDGRSDGRSSCPECTQAPKVVVPNGAPATGRG